MTRKVEYLHSWFILSITLYSLLFLLINPSFALNTILLLMVFYFYFKNGLRVRLFLKISFYALFFCLILFFLNCLHPAKALMQGSSYLLFGNTLYSKTVEHALQMSLKLFFVTLLSMSSGVVVNHSKVILYLMVDKRLKLSWGYPILLSINSISLFKDEFERIKINAKIRNLPFLDRLNILFPLLVFAIRHSQRGALSLVTRGLDENKSFYFSYTTSTIDKKRFQIFLILYFVLVVIALL